MNKNSLRPNECFINVYAVSNTLLQQGHWHLSRSDARTAAMYTFASSHWKTAYRIRVRMKGTKS